jgi:hypothetical protein
VSGTFALVVAGFILAVAAFTAGPVGAWPRVALFQCICAVLVVPAWLSGLVFLTGFMDKALYGPAGRSWLKVALVVAGSWLFMLLLLAAWSWPIWSAEWVYAHPFAMVLAGFLTAALHVCALAQSSLLRRRHQEEWERLPVDMPS